MESHQNQFFCDTFQIALNSKIQFDCHMTGQRHFKYCRLLKFLI